MIQTNRLLKVAVAWASIVWVVCFGGVALVPGIREWFAIYAFHTTSLGLGENVMTLTTFVSGLVIWNIIAVLATWLFAHLFNAIKRWNRARY